MAETATELRDEIEVTMSVLNSVLHKVNQLIEGEITPEEYDEWIENNDEMFKDGWMF